MGCGCLLVLLGSAFPRLALVLTWIFTERVDVAFDGGVLLPFAGLVFLPYTTLFWVIAYAPVEGVTGVGWILVTFGLLLDLAHLFGGGREGSRRRWRAQRVS